MKKLLSILITLFFVTTAFADTAKQVDFLFNGYRHPTTDKVLSGGKVKTYLTGTSTLSSLWIDKDKTATAANPVILDSAGRAEVYGDGIYKFEIYSSADVLLETLNGLEYKAFVDVISDDAYDPTGWNNDTGTAPSKNATRDKIVGIDADISAINAEIALGARALVTTQGDMIYASTANTLARLAIGAENLKLFVNNNIPSWAVGMKIGSFTRGGDSASGNQTVSGVGFTPAYVILVANKSGSAGTSVGFSNVTNDYCAFNNTGAVSNTWDNTSSNSILIMDNAAADRTQAGNLTSFNSDGFVVNWTKGAGTPSSDTITIFYFAFR